MRLTTSNICQYKWRCTQRLLWEQQKRTEMKIFNYMFERICVRRLIEMICLFHLHASVLCTFPWGRQYSNRSKNSWCGSLSPITWSPLCSDNIQLFGSQTQSSILQFVSKKLIFSPVKLEHFRKYELILKSTWVKIKLELVFHNVTIVSKYCLMDQVLLKIGFSYKSHTS